MVELLEYLRASGFKTLIVFGGGERFSQTLQNDKLRKQVNKLKLHENKTRPTRTQPRADLRSYSVWQRAIARAIIWKKTQHRHHLG